MSMDYANSSCEQKARELLVALAGSCPDSVWDNISADLATRRQNADSKWYKSANSPKTALIAAGVIAVVTLSSWMLFMNKGNKNKEEVTVLQPTVQPEKKNTPVVTENKPVPVAAVVKTDNIAQPQATSPAVQSQPVPVMVQPQSQVAMPNKVVQPVVTSPAAKQKATSNTNGSPMLTHNDDVFSMENPAPDAMAKQGESKVKRDSSAMEQKAVTSLQTQTSVADSTQKP